MDKDVMYHKHGKMHVYTSTWMNFNIRMIHQGSLKGTPEMICCHLWLSVRGFNYLRLMPHQIIKPMALVYKLVLRLIWKEKEKSQDFPTYK